MNKLMTYVMSAIVASLALGFMLGRLSANKLSKKVETSNIVTTEVKKQEVSVVQEVKKDSTVVKETTREIISYSRKGKITKREFIQDKIGTKTQIGTQLVKNDVILDSSFSEKKSNTISTYESNWMLLANYQANIDSSILTFNINNVELGLGYRLLGNFYADASTNMSFKYVKFGGILLL